MSNTNRSRPTRQQLRLVTSLPPQEGTGLPPLPQPEPSGSREMYPVDGATMSPNRDERGGFHDDAYVQIIDGQITRSSVSRT